MLVDERTYSLVISAPAWVTLVRLEQRRCYQYCWWNDPKSCRYSRWSEPQSSRSGQYNLLRDVREKAVKESIHCHIVAGFSSWSKYRAISKYLIKYRAGEIDGTQADDDEISSQVWKHGQLVPAGKTGRGGEICTNLAPSWSCLDKKWWNFQ